MLRFRNDIKLLFRDVEKLQDEIRVWSEEINTNSGQWMPYNN